ncbi:hypothetical protein UlMin_000305 [Ulmus minor]
MLAKQSWRLIRNPNSLVGKVLKACYFPNGDFLYVEKGKHASFVWRSIIWGREIIESGSRWRVGSGQNIDIFKDKWLPIPLLFKPSSHPPFPGNFNHLFVAKDASTILSLPVGSFDHADILFWHFTKDGEYTWKILWGLNLPPKVKYFCWKLCRGWLPSSLARSWHSMIIDNTCFHCKSHTESIFHALWNCSLVKDIWILCGFYHYIDINWEVVDGAVRWLEDFIYLVSLKSKRGNNRIDDARWIPLDRGKFLINVDAATNIKTGDHGLRIIIRESVGEVIVQRPFIGPFLFLLRL